MKYLLVMLCCLAVSCVAPKPKPRMVAFDAEDFAPYANAGTGAIEGQAFLRTRGGDVKVGAGSEVALNPVTGYTREWFDRKIVGGEAIESADARAARFSRTCIADAEGRFRFEGLAPGAYYVACRVEWEVNYGHSLQPAGGIAYAQVRVEDGKTTRAIVTR